MCFYRALLFQGEKLESCSFLHLAVVDSLQVSAVSTGEKLHLVWKQSTEDLHACWAGYRKIFLSCPDSDFNLSPECFLFWSLGNANNVFAWLAVANPINITLSNVKNFRDTLKSKVNIWASRINTQEKFFQNYFTGQEILLYLCSKDELYISTKMSNCKIW